MFQPQPLTTNMTTNMTTNSDSDRILQEKSINISSTPRPNFSKEGPIMEQDDDLSPCLAAGRNCASNNMNKGTAAKPQSRPHPTIPSIATKAMFPAPSLMSPTTSLAADMSQNFHIDRTPAVPTPRRNLFSNRPNASKILNPMNSSSYFMDTDIDSPQFPRKLPSNSSLASSSTTSFDSMSSRSSLSSLTSVESEDGSVSPGEDDTVTFTRPPIQPLPTKSVGAGRIRVKSLSNASFLLKNKPSLSWSLSGESDWPSSKSPQTSSLALENLSSSKTSSSSSSSSSSAVATLTSRSSHASDGMDIDTDSSSSLSNGSPSLDGFFQPSPIAGRMASNALMARDTFDSPISSLKCNSLAGTKIRRIHSMFQRPEDVMDQDEQHSSTDSSSLDTIRSPPMITESQSLLSHPSCDLKTFSVKEDPFKRIERHTLCELIDGAYKHLYDDHVIIDCRFEYEYEGGHIDGAVNINTKHDLESYLLENVKPARTLLVFHCEYSAHRGPRMAMHLRNCDRHLNMAHYPNLHYPDIVILQGGYSSFFQTYSDRCFPQRYVEMNDSSHRQACEREMNKFKRSMKFSRTQSYTFGSMQRPNANGATTGVPAFKSQSFGPQKPFNVFNDDENEDNEPHSTFRFPPVSEVDTTPTAPSSKNRLLRIQSERLFS